jgi:hypothetical protein
MTAALGAAMIAGSVSAEPTHHQPVRVDPAQVQILATQIEGALSGLGCSATSAQETAAIQMTIGTSGYSPATAEAALSVVQTWTGLCSGEGSVVAAVNSTIQLALAGSGPAAGPGGGPGGAAPIGAAPAYVGGGGSNYVP